jgi:hypothetical protein
MNLVCVALLSLCGWPAADDPAGLVTRLSSPKPAEREEAAGLLEERGRPALAVLYKARDTTNPEQRRRVDLLIDLIERQRLLHATKVTLDFDDRPLSEVVDAIRQRTGFPLSLETDAARKAKKVTLRAPEPQPFWTVLTRLHEAGGVRPNPGQMWPPPSSLSLVVDDGPPPPSDQAGPFRVNVVRISRHGEVVPARPPGKPLTRVLSSATLQVFAEPGLAIDANGPLVLTEAIDERGRDLRPDQQPPAPPRQAMPQRFDEAHLSLLSYQVPLRLPDEPGGRIKKLKGYAPITAVVQNEALIVATLAEAPGKPLSGGGVTLTVNRVERQAAFSTIDLSLRGVMAEPGFTPFPQSAPVGDYRPPFRLENHIRVVDDHGQPIPWSLNTQQIGLGGDMVVRLYVPAGQGRAPARVQYHDVVGVATEVAFEFDGLPLP